MVEALEQQFALWEKRMPGITSSAGAALALSLAAQLDNPSTKATAAANVANALDRVLARMEESLPPAESADDLDELRARRDKRITQ